MAIIDIHRNPSRKELRWFGILLLVFIGAVGGVLRWRADTPTASAAFWGLGGALVLTYALVPPSRRLIYLGWMYAVFPIGWTVSHILLAGIYYLVLTPIGLLLRLGRGDPLERRFDRSARSYWKPHRPGGDVARYFKQF